MLLSLPQRDRDILLAWSSGNDRYAADLAEQWGMSAGAIRVRCSRLQERVRVEMQRRGFGLPEQAL